MCPERLAAGRIPVPPVVVTKEDVAAEKPSPEGYRLALRQLRIAARDAIPVEDSPAGITAAKAAGLRTITVATTHETPSLEQADIVIPGMHSIKCR